MEAYDDARGRGEYEASLPASWRLMPMSRKTPASARMDASHASILLRSASPVAKPGR